MLRPIVLAVVGMTLLPPALAQQQQSTEGAEYIAPLEALVLPFRPTCTQDDPVCIGENLAELLTCEVMCRGNDVCLQGCNEDFDDAVCPQVPIEPICSECVAYDSMKTCRIPDAFGENEDYVLTVDCAESTPDGVICEPCVLQSGLGQDLIGRQECTVCGTDWRQICAAEPKPQVVVPVR
jgi:hypothetical protein